jgi:hypothetical protein
MTVTVTVTWNVGWSQSSFNHEWMTVVTVIFTWNIGWPSNSPRRKVVTHHHTCNHYVFTEIKIAFCQWCIELRCARFFSSMICNTSTGQRLQILHMAWTASFYRTGMGHCEAHQDAHSHHVYSTFFFWKESRSTAIWYKWGKKEVCYNERCYKTERKTQSSW